MTATATPPPDAAPAEPLPASVTAVVGLLVLFEVTSGFLQVGLAPLLPDLADHLGMGSAALNWVVSVQLLAAAVCVPLFGRLGDLYGHRRTLRVATALIAAGTLVVALARTTRRSSPAGCSRVRSPRCCRWRSPSYGTGSRSPTHDGLSPAWWAR